MTDKEQKIAHIKSKTEFAIECGSARIKLGIGEVTLLLSEIDRLQQERDKAIEGLKGFAERDPYATSAKAKRILSELGVPL